MGTFGISTSMGAIKFGVLKRLNKYNSEVVIPPATDLLAFSRLPDVPISVSTSIPEKIPSKSVANVAKLKNGNEIWFWNHRYNSRSGDTSDDWLYIEFHDYVNPNNNYNGYVQYAGVNPRFFGGKRYTMQLGFFTQQNPDGGISLYGHAKEDFNLPPEQNDFRFIPGMQLPAAARSEDYPDTKMVPFTKGSLLPVFPGEDSGEESEKNPGGDGEGPDGVEDDPIEIPEDPSLSAANAGLLTLYTPTLSQIHNLGSYLWSDSFSLDTFKKLFSDPMEAIIGLSVVPVSVPTTGAQNIVIGVTDSGVSANRAASQYVTVDCGTISVKPTWNTAIDFEPYTKFSVFLPFIGTREISTDDIMGKDVNIKYLVDVFSGACTAHIKVGGSVLYQFSGSCTTPIPISALSWSNLVTSSIGLLAGGTAAAAAGGVAGGVALAAMTAGAVARSKPTIQRAGNVSGAAGMLGVRVPYLIRETPRQSLAKDYNKFVGYPSNITSKLSDLTGYTQVENVHLEGIPATGDELSEIESLLKEGVIL